MATMLVAQVVLTMISVAVCCLIRMLLAQIAQVELESFQPTCAVNTLEFVLVYL